MESLEGKIRDLQVVQVCLWAAVVFLFVGHGCSPSIRSLDKRVQALESQATQQEQNPQPQEPK